MVLMVVCYVCFHMMIFEMFEMLYMDIDVLRQLCNELKMLRFIKEDNGAVGVEELVAMFLYIIRHNTRMRVVADHFQHSPETVQHRFWRVLWSIHKLRKILNRPNAWCNDYPHPCTQMGNTTHGLRYNYSYATWWDLCFNLFRISLVLLLKD